MKHQGELGFIEYRLPTIPETLELWGRMGVEPADLIDEKSPIRNSFFLMSKVIAHMGFLLLRVEYKIGDKSISSYEALRTNYAAMSDLCAVAGRIVEVMNGGSEDKKKS